MTTDLKSRVLLDSRGRKLVGYISISVQNHNWAVKGTFPFETKDLTPGDLDSNDRSVCQTYDRPL